MKTKDIYQFGEIREKILSGLGKLSRPVVQTLTPKGKNVIFQDEGGFPNATNDGKKIADNIILEDPIEATVAGFVRQAAIRTNNIAGDGTTTTILFADNMIRQGFQLIDSGYNQMDLKRYLDRMSDILAAEIPKYTFEVKGKKDLEYVARVSSNNDYEIAKNTADVINKAQEDGLVFIETNPQKSETKIVEELGFLLDSGMISQYMGNIPGRFIARYDNVPVLITDKRLYYEEEVIAILNEVAKNGWSNIIIIASDFIGQVPNFLIANHTEQKINMNILAIKCSDPDTLEDLAQYLGGQVYTEKRGSMAEELKREDFIIANKIWADPSRSVITSEQPSVTSKLRLNAIRESIKDTDEGSAEYDKLKKRIARLTNGMITVKVGGKTVPEMNEKIYRYEDAINATRSALKHGYVVGGGATLYTIYKNLSPAKLKGLPEDLREVMAKFCQTSLRQIAKNCNESFQKLLDKTEKVVGYNALTGEFENLLEAGVIEPSIVLKMAIENSISVAGLILSSDYMIVNKINKNGNKNDDSE